MKLILFDRGTVGFTSPWSAWLKLMTGVVDLIQLLVFSLGQTWKLSMSQYWKHLKLIQSVSELFFNRNEDEMFFVLFSSYFMELPFSVYYMQCKIYNVLMEVPF